MPLPTFMYHPDPIATGAIEKSDAACVCCAKKRGYIYVGPVYGEMELHERLCPWCIADGSAATKLGASFADAYPLSRAGVAPEIAEEINLRTPAYVCWQEPEWLSHCNDACEFHGDATAKDAAEAVETTKMDWMARYKQDEAAWKRVVNGYAPGRDSALYKFVCRHCGAVLFGWDLS